MDTWLKGLIAAACVVIIAQGAVSAWDWYERYSAQQAEEAVEHQAAAQKLMQKATFERQLQEQRDNELLPKLRATGCKQEVIDLLYVASMKRVKSSDDVAPNLAENMRVCLKYGIIGADSLAKIKGDGLADIFYSG